jgi:hypothetical protein
MDLRRELCRAHAELRGKINSRAAAETVATVRETLVALMLMVRGVFSSMVGVLFRAGLGVNGAQMKHGVSIAARKCERQQQDQTAREQGLHHGIVSRTS